MKNKANIAIDVKKFTAQLKKKYASHFEEKQVIEADEEWSVAADCEIESDNEDDGIEPPSSDEN